VLGRTHAGRPEQDVFPTLYRCNTPRALQRALARHGFDAVAYGAEAEPVYLAFSRMTYALGLLHRRLAPGALRPGLHAFGRRTDAGAD
jgi:hypothetical protein